jgi:hypothetical protein
METVDSGHMHAAGVRGSSFAAIAAGVRAQINSRMLSGVMEDAGMMNGTLAEEFDAVNAAARQLTDAGLAGARLDLVGTLIDALG